jgi:hypothetical protein
MRAHRLEVTVPPNGQLQLNLLPFQPGEPVEIIILALENTRRTASQGGEGSSSSALHIKRKQAKKPRRQATLTAIQRGKYASIVASSDLLPSERFALSKEEEKIHEERRWRS